MNSLKQFFTTTQTGGFVATLFSDLLNSPIGSVFLYINTAISIFVVFTICKQIIARALTAGETAKATGSAAFAIRLAILPIFCFPAVDGKLSIAQTAVLKIAEFGSNFGDFVYSKIPDINNSISLSFSSTSTIPVKMEYSGDTAQIVGDIYKLRYCQYRLSWLGDYTIPPVSARTVGGATVLNFPGPHGNRTPQNLCGSITLPLSSTDKSADFFSRAGNALFSSFSSAVADEILNAHTQSIQTTITEADAAIRAAFPTTTVWQPENFVKLTAQMQNSANLYQSMMASAGGVVFANETESKSLVDYKFGWVGAGFSFTSRSNQIAGRAAALTWRPTIIVNDISRAYPLHPIIQKTVENIDLPFEYSLQSAGLSRASKGAAAGGADFESILGARDIRAALSMFANPFANPFEVTATVGPILSGVAAVGVVAYGLVSYFSPGLGSLISFLLGSIGLAGQALTIILPLSPSIAWFFLILNWFSAVTVLFATVSFYAISLTRDDSNNLITGKINELSAKALVLLFTPSVLIVGLAFLMPVIKLGWFFIITSITPAIQNTTSQSAIASALSLIILTLFIVSLISSLIYFSLSKLAAGVKSLSEFLDSSNAGGALGVGERVTGGENVTAAPLGGGPARQQSTPPGTSGTPGGGPVTPAGLGGGDKNAQHVVSPTRGSRN